MQPASILRHYQATHTAFLHALGEKGTEQLIQHLNFKGQEQVLEVGIGTGATLVKLKSRYPQLALAGLDADPAMLKKCKSRLAFCRLKNKIPLHAGWDQLPAHSMQVVYLESVLGILEDRSLQITLQHIQKVLQPGGLLALNESIWLDSVSPTEIAAINQQCLQAFGIIQCTPHFAGLANTSNFIQNFGFQGIVSQQMHPQIAPSVRKKNFREYLSRLYSLLGKIRLLLNRDLRQTDQRFKADMKKIFKPDKAYLSGVILIFKKS